MSLIPVKMCKLLCVLTKLPYICAIHIFFLFIPVHSLLQNIAITHKFFININNLTFDWSIWIDMFTFMQLVSSTQLSSAWMLFRIINMKWLQLAPINYLNENLKRKYKSSLNENIYHNHSFVKWSLQVAVFSVTLIKWTKVFFYVGYN